MESDVGGIGNEEVAPAKKAATKPKKLRKEKAAQKGRLLDETAGQEGHEVVPKTVSRQNSKQPGLVQGSKKHAVSTPRWQDSQEAAPPTSSAPLKSPLLSRRPEGT